MIEAVFVGTLIPLVFLILALKGETKLLLGFFAWGLVAFTLALFINTQIYEVGGISREHLAVTWGPVVEEFLKALPLIYFLISKKDLKYSVFYFAMASGIGFSIQENYLYLFENYGNSVSPITFIIIRSVTTCIMHGMSVAILGYGIQIIRKIRIFTLPVLFGLFSLAVTFHALYNLYVDSSIKLIGLLLPILLYLTGVLIVKEENPPEISQSDIKKEGANEEKN